MTNTRRPHTTHETTPHDEARSVRSASVPDALSPPAPALEVRESVTARPPFSQDAAAVVSAGASRAARSRGHVHLLVGPVGAGKSTLGAALVQNHRAVPLALDVWMATLFRPDRAAVEPSDIVAWYGERAARCVARILDTTLAIVDAGTDVVLEIGLLRLAERDRFRAWAEENRVALTVRVVDADRDVRRGRVEARNEERGATFSMVVPPAVFELASDLWEPVEAEEWPGADVRWMRTDTPATLVTDEARLPGGDDSGTRHG